MAKGSDEFSKQLIVWTVLGCQHKFFRRCAKYTFTLQGCEHLIADIALIRLLSTVGQSVVLVVALLVETLATELALERLVPVVNPHVSVQS